MLNNQLEIYLIWIRRRICSKDNVHVYILQKLSFFSNFYFCEIELIEEDILAVILRFLMKNCDSVMKFCWRDCDLIKLLLSCLKEMLTRFFTLQSQSCLSCLKIMIINYAHDICIMTLHEDLSETNKNDCIKFKHIFDIFFIICRLNNLVEEKRKWIYILLRKELSWQIFYENSCSESLSWYIEMSEEQC